MSSDFVSLYHFLKVFYYKRHKSRILEVFVKSVHLLFVQRLPYRVWSMVALIVLCCRSLIVGTKIGYKFYSLKSAQKLEKTYENCEIITHADHAS